MSVKVTGMDKALDVLHNVSRFQKSKKPMKKIVDDVSDRIDERTAAGLDFEGKRFVPYSAAYAKKKGKRKVDLKDTGLMLKSKKKKVLSPTHGRITIANTQNRQVIAAIHNEGIGKQKKRAFLDITKAGFAKIVKKHYDDPIGEMAKGSPYRG